MKSLLCLLFCSMAFSQELSLPEYRLPTAEVVEHEPGPDDRVQTQVASEGAWYRLVLRMLEALESSQTQALESMLDSGFDRRPAALGIQSAWQSQKSRYGSFKEIRQLGGRKVEYHPEITGILNFDRGKTGLKVTLSYFEPRHIVKVEFLHPRHIPAQAQVLRDYVDEDAITVIPFEFGPTQYPIQARMYAPKSKTDFDVVLFLHDFGPQDATHRQGIHQPYLDFAQGLATSGIAAVLFPKRSYIYSDESLESSRNPYHEVVSDVHSIVSVLKMRGMLKPTQKIYLVCNGFSAWFMPYFAKRNLFDGFILLNPSFRHPLEIQFEIEEFQSAANPKSYSRIVELSQKLSRFFQGDTDPEERFFGYPARYYTILDAFRPEEISSSSHRVLLLFAKYNFLSNPADEPEFLRVLKNTQVTRIDFERLNRMFQLGTKNPGQDLYTPGAVSPRVIRILTQWLNKQ